MPPPKWGLGFSFFVFRCPLLVKSGLVKTTFENIPIFAKRLLRGIRVNSSHFLFLFLKLFIACGFEIKIRYVFRSAYLRNGFDKLFGYQYLSAILPERLTTQAMLVLFLPYCLQAISSSGANSSQ